MKLSSEPPASEQWGQFPFVRDASAELHQGVAMYEVSRDVGKLEYELAVGRGWARHEGSPARPEGETRHLGT